MRGRVCKLLLLLGLACAVPLESESREIQVHILNSKYFRFPSLEGQVPWFIYPRDMVAIPGTGFPFRRILRHEGLRWRYSNPPPHVHQNICCFGMLYILLSLAWNYMYTFPGNTNNFFFCFCWNTILFAMCIYTFSKLVWGLGVMAWAMALISALP
jgi:hypothetical protein